MAAATEEVNSVAKQEQSEELVSSESSSQENTVSALEKKIIRQVEFYFGDRNLQRDKFLQDKIKEDEGWVLLEVLLTFNRLKSLSTDISVIVGALRKSTSGLLEVNDDGSKVRRCPALPTPTISLLSQEQRKELRDRTAFVKGFPEDSSLDEIQELLDQYGETVLVQMRKMRPPDEKKFKGSVFAEYKNKESLEKLLAAREEVRFRGSHELLVETKEGWMTRKAMERKNPKQEQSAITTSTEEEQEGNKRQYDAAIIRAKKKACILHMKGIAPDTTREIIKEHFRQFATVAWVEFQKGDKEGYVRFEEEEGACKAGDTAKLCDADVTLKVLEGEEEQQYWEKMADDMSKRKKRKPSGGWRGGRGRRGGWKRTSAGETPAARGGWKRTSTGETPAAKKTTDLDS